MVMSIVEPGNQLKRKVCKLISEALAGQKIDQPLGSYINEDQENHILWEFSFEGDLE